MSKKKIEIERKAQALLEYLKTGIRYDPEHLPRPFMLEITGTPSAGKTTTITEIDKFFRRIGFERVWKPQEGAEVIRHIPRTTPEYNIRTANYALNLLLDNAYGHNYDLVIFDRCIFDAYCWMNYWERKGKLNADEARNHQIHFLSKLWTNYLDTVFIMTCSPETAMKRELKLALSSRLGETTNPKSIKTLSEIWKAAYETLKNNHPQLHYIDTTLMDEQEMIETVALKALEAFEKRVNVKTAR